MQTRAIISTRMLGNRDMGNSKTTLRWAALPRGPRVCRLRVCRPLATGRDSGYHTMRIPLRLLLFAPAPVTVTTDAIPRFSSSYNFR